MHVPKIGPFQDREVGKVCSGCVQFERKPARQEGGSGRCTHLRIRSPTRGVVVVVVVVVVVLVVVCVGS
jgi:hypothetical protein